MNDSLDHFALPIPLGRELELNAGGIYVPTRKRVYIPPETLPTHYHFWGATGSGKTNSLTSILAGVIMDNNPHQSFFIIDPLGPWSQTMLRFLTNPDYCNDDIRRRVVYLEPSYEDVVTTINPLRHNTRQHLDFQLARTMAIILRGFASAELDAMPRLRLWLYRALFALSLLGYPLAIGKYLLNPRLEEHKYLIRQLPAEERAEWHWLIKEGGNQAHHILESTRNRMSLFSGNYVVLSRMFSSCENLFDVGRLMEEGAIVIVNLSPGLQRLDRYAATTIGSLLIYEVLSHGMTQFAKNKRPTDTFLVVDEFHRFLSGSGGGDIIEYLPIIRNMGIHLLCANQSNSQLVTPELDLRPLVAQFRSRLLFANDFEDATAIAEELAHLTWDPDEVKRQYWSRRQRINGHRKEILESWGRVNTDTSSWSNQASRSRGANTPIDPTRRGSLTDGHGTAHVDGGSSSEADSRNSHEQLVPEYEDFEELVKEDFVGYDEEVHRWQQRVRGLRAGQAIAKFANDPELHPVLVDLLPLDEDDPRTDERVEELKQENYERGPFISAAEADRQLEEHRQRLMRGDTIHVRAKALPAPRAEAGAPVDPFCD